MRLPLGVSLVTLIACFFVVTIQLTRLPKPSHAAQVAYTRLQEIARSPHPYNSARNDEVRAYLLKSIMQDCPSALDESDNSTLWVSPASNPDVKISTYFEQNNLVIVLPSSQKNVQEAVLMSAHYDSVSSSNGATDDGMALTVLLSLVKKYCEHKLPADLVFNINNAEEDGLFGAQAFLSHKRMKFVKSFVNLEGAGAGGAAMLFRTTGAEVAKAYKGSKLPRSSIAGNDFFQRHLIKSETDFVIYAPFVPGLDIAFYAPRSLYHTQRDGTRTTSPWSIEHMLSAAEHSMLNLAKQQPLVDNKNKNPFFFDFLGLFFYSSSLNALLWLDLAILIMAPILLGAGFSIRSYFGKVKFVGMGRTFAALLLQIALVAGLSLLITMLNPYIIHSSATLYSATILLGSFASNLFATRLLISRVQDQHDLSRVMSWELCIIWYVLLFISTITSLALKIGSTYLVTINFLAAFAVALVSLFERSAYVPPQETFDSVVAARRDSDAGSTESSPLLRRDLLAPEVEEEIRQEKRRRDYRSAATWIVKFLILVPIPALVCLWLLYATILPGLDQTLPDGSPGTTVYAIVALFSILTFFNLAPFFLSTSLSSALPALLLLLLCASLTCVFKSPFSVKAPLKVYYRQFVDLDAMSSHVAIEGLPGYMDAAVSELALAKKGLSCHRGSTRGKRLNTCTFSAPVDSRLAKSGIETTWISVKDSRHASLAVNRKKEKDGKKTVLQIHSAHSKICDLQMEEVMPIVAINGEPVDARDAHIRLYRRGFETPFEIEFGKTTGDDDTDEGTESAHHIKGRVMCFWDDRSDGRIASFDTVQRELPEWVEVSKRDTGLIWYSRNLTLTV
ncbi:hypothetical protein BCR37DRAFT_394161 [Protomyces lactucae-debilis]|uniref:Peptide hydrolase n=1 Tax=Protomyces lactucae-debilis TaxID=2754530 RepID=A0A1Y2F6A1_PROLT|nr:uncharacterized protein BCR37DRAFT_394161 [Protomyces lactucae-debilis]ORY79430.1 hypothetical protein BCR37DRAFT_394161 [Protomyces lactucae-debilis]